MLRLSLGGLTLTLLQEDPPPAAAGAPSLAQVFFRELAFFKDSMFSERDFTQLRSSFAKACPHSNIRWAHARAHTHTHTHTFDADTHTQMYNR